MQTRQKFIESIGIQSNTAEEITPLTEEHFSMDFQHKVDSLNQNSLHPLLRTFLNSHRIQNSFEIDQFIKPSLTKIYAFNPNKLVYLCHYSDSPSKYFCRWTSQSDILNDNTGVTVLKDFNNSTYQSIFLDIISNPANIFNNPISPIEIITEMDNKYLMRYELESKNIYCWETHQNSLHFDKLLEDYHFTTDQRKPPEITDGIQFIINSLKQNTGLIFCGFKDDLIDVLLLEPKTAMIVIPEDVFNWWCQELSKRKLAYIGYYGDDFTKQIIRQFKITKEIHFLLITHSMIENDKDYFHNIKFDYLIVDGTEKIKKKSLKVLDSFRFNYKIVYLNTPTTKELERCIDFTGASQDFIYLPPDENHSKYIFIRPTDYQLALFAAKPTEWNEICQTSLLSTAKLENNNTRFFYEKYSAKFLFLGKIISNINEKIVLLFKRKELLQLCERYLGFFDVSFKSPNNDTVSELIELQLDENYKHNSNLKVIGVDCLVENGYNLVLFGTGEHYFYSIHSIEHNLRGKEIIEVIHPPLLSFDHLDNLDFDTILKTNSTVVDSSPFNFEPLGPDHFIDSHYVKRSIKSLIQHNFQPKDDFDKAIQIALFRAADPVFFSYVPICFSQLTKYSDILYCVSKSQWLDPLIQLFPQIDFTPFKNLQKYFFKNSPLLLRRCEHSALNLLWSEKKLNSSNDNETTMDVNRKKEEIVFPSIDNIKDDLYKKVFHNFPYWVDYELDQIATMLVNHLPTAHLLSKSPENIEHMAMEISECLINSQKVQVENTKQFLATGIPSMAKIDESDQKYFEIQYKIAFFVHELSLITPSLIPQCFAEQMSISQKECLNVITELETFGAASYLKTILLSPKFPFLKKLTKDDICYLKGEYALVMNEDSGIPKCFRSDFSFLKALCLAFNECFNLGMESRQIKPVNHNVQQHSNTYTPPNDLLQRAADLQNQKKIEKKLKQMNPIHSTRNTKPAPMPLNSPLINPVYSYQQPNMRKEDVTILMPNHQYYNTNMIQNVTEMNKPPMIPIFNFYNESAMNQKVPTTNNDNIGKPTIIVNPQTSPVKETVQLPSHKQNLYVTPQIEQPTNYKLLPPKKKPLIQNNNS